MKKLPSKNKYMNGADRTNQILDVACRLFAEKSYDAVSIREIASECDCSPALIMKNFKSKEDIYSALLDEWREMCNEPLIKELPDGDACIVLKNIYTLLSSGGDQKSHAYRHQLSDAIATRTSYRSVIADIKKDIQDIASEIILPLIIRGQEEGSVKQGEPKEIADSVWFTIYGNRLLEESFNDFAIPDFDFVKELILSE